jgi:hypothetical protein
LTATKATERTFPAALFSRPPVSGDIFTSLKGTTHFAVLKVRKLLDRRGGVRFQLTGMTLRPADLPPGSMPLPWPQPRQRRPSRAAMPEAIHHPIVSLQTKRALERKRIIAARHDETDHRLKTGVAVEADWRDPDDIDPRNRTSPRAKSARIIHGTRAVDVILHLAEIGTISRSQKGAAQRFRREYDLGEIGLRAGRNLAEEPGGFGPGAGPSASRLLHLERWQATIAAMRTNGQVLMAIIIGNQFIKDFAANRRLNRGIATGMLLNALEFLRSYYKELDDDEQARQEA